MFNVSVLKQFFNQGVKIVTGGPGEHVLSAYYYYSRDHLGSIRELTDSGGNVQTRYSYDPFGRRTRLTGTVDADFGFADMFWSTEASLNLTKFRAYDPDIGRWLSRDPLQDAEQKQGPNLYVYAENNPVNRIDLDGLDPETPPGVDKWCFSLALLAYALCKRVNPRTQICKALADAVLEECQKTRKPPKPPSPNCVPSAQCCPPDPVPVPNPDGGAPPGGVGGGWGGGGASGGGGSGGSY